MAKTNTKRAPRALALGLGAFLLGIAGGCAGEHRYIPRPSAGEEVDIGRARAATEAADWQVAASLWNELFLRGGEERVMACQETARALTELSDLESARSILELGMRRDPDHPALLETQGDVLARMGFRRAAESSYVRAIEAEPDRPHALLELARIRIELGRPHLALDALRQRLALGLVDAETYLLRARAQAECNQPEEAYDSFVKAFELGADDPLFLVSAACLSFDERLSSRESCRKHALGWLALAVESDPQLTLAHFYLGVMQEEGGDLGRALQHYERAVETDPGHSASLTRLACGLNAAGNFERASTIALRALEVEKDPSQRTRLKRIAGR